MCTVSILHCVGTRAQSLSQSFKPFDDYQVNLGNKDEDNIDDYIKYLWMFILMPELYASENRNVLTRG